MGRYKSNDKKNYLRAQRTKIGTGFNGAPVWVMQKSGKRIWNLKQNRHWRRTSLGHQYDRAVGNI